MDPSTTARSSLPSTNPPSVETAYRKKCIALKRRLNEIEAENEIMRLRNRRGWQYIQKMRLESCILLERLAKVTGMAEEAQVGMNPELRARAAAMMSNAAAFNNLAARENGHPRLEDETEGSSEEQPPTPQERPLRVKRSRKSNINVDGLDDDVAESTPAGPLPRIAPAPTQEELTSTFRINGSATPAASAANEKDIAAPPAKESAGHHTSREQDETAEPRASEGSSEPKPPSTTPMDVDAKEPKEESQG